MRRLAQLFVAIFVAVAPMLSVQVVPAHAETQTLESFVGGVESQIDDFWRQSSLSHGMLYSSPRYPVNRVRRFERLAGCLVSLHPSRKTLVDQMSPEPLQTLPPDEAY